MLIICWISWLCTIIYLKNLFIKKINIFNILFAIYNNKLFLKHICIIMKSRISDFPDYHKSPTKLSPSSLHACIYLHFTINICACFFTLFIIFWSRYMYILTSAIFIWIFLLLPCMFLISFVVISLVYHETLIWYINCNLRWSHR